MSDEFGISYLLGALAETCDARGWALEISYDGGWTVAVCEARRSYRPIVPEGHGETAQEALAIVWARVMRFCHAEAARGHR